MGDKGHVVVAADFREGLVLLEHAQQDLEGLGLALQVWVAIHVVGRRVLVDGDVATLVVDEGWRSRQSAHLALGQLARRRAELVDDIDGDLDRRRAGVDR